MSDKDDVRAKMLGSVAMPDGHNTHEVDVGQLCQAFDKPGRSVAWMFCNNCNHYVEITRERVVFLTQESPEVAAMTSFAGFYFETKGCLSCIRKQPDIVLKEIPRH